MKLIVIAVAWRIIGYNYFSLITHNRISVANFSKTSSCVIKKLFQNRFVLGVLLILKEKQRKYTVLK